MNNNVIFPVWHKYPYLIVAPAYSRTSVGIKALHMLCHTLNHKGARAFVTTKRVSNDLDTPVASRQLLEEWQARNITPIVIYPETVSGNPLAANCVVRYLLNFPGLLGGDSHQHAEDMYVSYSLGMNPWAQPGQEMTLFMPLVDTRVFCLPAGSVTRSGSCYYAYKYKVTHKAKTFPITANSVEITRGKTDSQTPEEIAALFQRSEVFYAYENTALVLEALLCGCPVVYLPNPHLDAMIATKEIGTNGIAWGTDSAELSRAVATVRLAAENYEKTVRQYWPQLDSFIARTQDYAALRPQKIILNHVYLEANSDNWPQSGTARTFLRLYVILNSIFSADRKTEISLLCEFTKQLGFAKGFKKWVSHLYGIKYQSQIMHWLSISNNP